jgi:hypothetical protein
MTHVTDSTDSAERGLAGIPCLVDRRDLLRMCVESELEMHHVLYPPCLHFMRWTRCSLRFRGMSDMGSLVQVSATMEGLVKRKECHSQ